MIIAPWEHAEAVKRWLSSCDTEGDAKITDMSGTVAALTIEGPESWKAVQDILDTDVTGIGIKIIGDSGMERRRNNADEDRKNQ